MAFKYRERDDQVVKDRATQTGGAFDSFIKSSIPKYKVKDTGNNIRILPPTWSDTEKWGNNFGIDIYMHYGIGADDAAYLCPAKMNNEDCCICDDRANQPPLEEGERDELKPGRRVLIYLIDRDNEKDGPMWWAMPWTVERDFQELSIDSELGILHIDHPDEGYDISFGRSGKGRNTKYVGLKIARKSSPIHPRPKEQEKILEFIEENPLPDILHIYDNDYLTKIYHGKVSHKQDRVDGAEGGDKKGDAKEGRRGRTAERIERPERGSGKTETTRSTRGRSEPDPIKLEVVEDMTESELKDAIKEYDLKIDPDNFERVSKLRAKVIEELEAANMIAEDKPAEPEPESDTRGGRGGKGKDKDEPLLTMDELDDMDGNALEKLIKEHRLNVDADDYPRESKLREAVADALQEQGLLASDDPKPEPETRDGRGAREERGGRAASTSEARDRLKDLKESRETRSRGAERPSRPSRR